MVYRVLPVILTLAAALPAVAQKGPGEAERPFQTGMVERTGITLMFLDVEVTDEEGRPLPGLTLDDFEVQINGRFRPLYSVDDLCACAPEVGTAVAGAEDPLPAAPAPAGGVEARGAEAARSPGPVPQRPRYVLYFDFSQLQQDGRARAAREARRWILESMGAHDQASVVAYASVAGLRELSPFTGDKQELLDAIESGLADPDLVDPFPAGFSYRIRECKECCAKTEECTDCGTRCCAAVCRGNARDELQHGRRSLKALIALLGRLESEPGPKSLILFHQNGVIYPSRFYPVPEMLDHVALLDAAGAEATLARTVVNPAYSGSTNRLENELAGQAVSLGANLAEFTGGRYNRGNTDLTALLDETVKSCTCTYRIGIRPPVEYKQRVFRVRVWVRGEVVPYRYRTVFLDDTDRWWRRAQGVLADPDRAAGVEVTTGIVPDGLSGKNWDLTVQVGLDVASLMLFPSAGEQRGEWEVGALLYREGGTESWEMLGRSRLSLDRDAADPTATVLHQRTFDGLIPGEYRLAAFVRDRAASVFGAAETSIVLPGRKQGGVAGPVLLRGGVPVVPTALPLLEEKADPATRNAEAAIGRVPAAGEQIERGATLEFLTWICPARRAEGAGRPLRFVSRYGEPLFRFEDSEDPPAESCFRVEDRVETLALEPGAYAYHLRWNGAGAGAPIERDLGFQVAPVTNLTD